MNKGPGPDQPRAESGVTNWHPPILRSVKRTGDDQRVSQALSGSDAVNVDCGTEPGPLLKADDVDTLFLTQETAENTKTKEST